MNFVLGVLVVGAITIMVQLGWGFHQWLKNEKIRHEAWEMSRLDARRKANLRRVK